MKSPEFVVLCGLSGAGRSTAAAHLEDLGWFVIDNVPPALLPKLGDLAGGGGSEFEKVAIVVRSGADDALLPALAGLGAKGRLRILFLDAATDVLVRRYEDTRRRHPGTGAEGGSVAAAIEDERRRLGPLKEIADVVVDTGTLNVHQLRARMADLLDGEGTTGMRVNILSFGYKHGLPIDVDLVLDCRFLPNPHWVDELRPQTGLDAPVRDYVLAQPDAAPFLTGLDGLLSFLLPAYQREGRTYLSIALGCTGGRHRSVAMAEALAELIRSHGFDPTVTHRDVAR